MVVLAFEVGGRWSLESWDFLKKLVRLRVRRAPPLLRRAAALGWHRRWTCLLSVAAQKALASILLEPSARASLGPQGLDEPDLAEVLRRAELTSRGVKPKVDYVDDFELPSAEAEGSEVRENQSTLHTWGWWGEDG